MRAVADLPSCTSPTTEMDQERRSSMFDERGVMMTGLDDRSAVLYVADDGEVAVIDDTDDPTAAPYSSLSYVLSRELVPGMVGEAWELIVYPPDDPGSDLVDFTTGWDDPDYDAAVEWAVTVIKERHDELVNAYISAGYGELANRGRGHGA